MPLDLDEAPDGAIDPIHRLSNIEEFLAVITDPRDDGAPFMFADPPSPANPDPARVQAFLVLGTFYAALEHALRYDQAGQAGRGDNELDALARPLLDHVRRLPDHIRLVTPADIIADLPEITEHIHHQTLIPVAVGRHGTPEAVLVTTMHYNDLVDAHMHWHQSPHFLATLDPSIHKPMPASKPIGDIESWVKSFGPNASAAWERVMARRAARDRGEGSGHA